MSFDKNQQLFGYTGNMTEKCPRFTWRIENFSLHTTPGQWTTSPVFQSPKSNQRWCLKICVWERCDKYPTRNGKRLIKIYLKRQDGYVSKQLVDVNLTIVSRFSVLWVETIKKSSLLFDNSRDYAILFSEAEDYFSSVSGLLYLPNDTLTLQCSMVIHTECTSAEGQFEDDYRKSIELGEQNRKSLPWFKICLLIIIFILAIILAQKNSH